MNVREVLPLPGELSATVTAPPSKAYTLRAIFISSLATGESTLSRPLLAEDQLVAIEAMRAFGADIRIREGEVVVNGAGEKLLAPATVFAANSGVTMRFLCSIAALAGTGGEKILLDGNARMRKRPVGDLLAALSQLGARARSVGGNSCPPVEVIGKSLQGGKASVDASKSSQFLSSLLVALPLAPEDSVVSVTGELSSRPYVDMTLDCMHAFGITVEGTGETFRVHGGQAYSGRTCTIEGDYSSSAFFFEAAAITGGSICVLGLRRESLQGDRKVLSFLQKMGCTVKQGEHDVLVHGPEHLLPFRADLHDYPDIVMPLAVACAFASGTSVLGNIGHLRLKESDRLASLEQGLKAIGAGARIEGDSLVIEGKPGKLRGASIKTFDDHRIAMAFSIAGLHLPYMRIENPDCVKKSFPSFFEELEKMRSP